MALLGPHEVTKIRAGTCDTAKAGFKPAPATPYNRLFSWQMTILTSGRRPWDSRASIVTVPATVDGMWTTRRQSHKGRPVVDSMGKEAIHDANAVG